MTLSLVELLSVLLVPAFLGAGLLRLQGVGARTDPLAFAGWCWLQGSLGVAVVLSGWLWLGLPLRASALAPVLLALGAAALVLGRRVPLTVAPAEERGFPRWERVCFVVVLAVTLAIALDRAFVATGLAIVHSDEGYLWSAKAKALFAAGGFGQRFREIMATPGVVSHEDYPPLNPLLQIWVFAHAKGIVHVENRWPLQAFVIAQILVVAAAARRRARPLVAAIFVACVGLAAFTRFSLAHPFSDHIVAFGLLVCWDLWQRWEEDGQTVWLCLLGTSAPLLVWTKNEGLMLVLAAGVALLLASASRRARWPELGRRPRRLALLVPLALSVLYLVWFNRHFGFQNDLFGEGPGEGDEGGEGSAFLKRALATNASAPWTIVTHFAGLIASHYSAYLPLAFLVLVLVSLRSAFARGRAAFTLGLLFALGGYMAVYLGTHWELKLHLTKSAHRLVHHLVLCAGLWVLLFVVEALPWAGSGRVGRSGARDP